MSYISSSISEDSLLRNLIYQSESISEDTAEALRAEHKWADGRLVEEMRRKGQTLTIFLLAQFGRFPDHLKVV